MALLSTKKLEAYKELIELNPDGFKDQISTIKNAFPKELGDISAIDPEKLDSLSKDRLFAKLESYRQKNLVLLPPQSLATGMEIILADPTKDNFFA